MAAIAAGIAVGLFAVVPLPYFILAPGHAIDLATRVAIEGGAAPRAHFLLTDVAVERATGLGLLARLLPATEIVASTSVLPQGESPETFDRTMADAMTESQNVAGFVAERAAGYRIAEDFIVRVEGFPPHSPASRTLARDDLIRAVAGRPVHGTADIARAIRSSHADALLAVTFERAGKSRTVPIPAMLVGGRRMLGVYLSSRLPVVDLPVPVRFTMQDVSGSSAGLMFALQIYAGLRSLAYPHPIAGTGTLAPDGTVGPIEGTRQKFEAARRAGATIFFVPTQNARDLAAVSKGGIAIVPVKRFSDALAYVTRSGGRSN